jgi:hypothetical protein
VRPAAGQPQRRRLSFDPALATSSMAVLSVSGAVADAMFRHDIVPFA